MTAPLRLVRPAEPQQPERDLYAYEAEQRRRSAAKRWDLIHIAADKREPVSREHRPAWKGWRR